LPRFSQAKAFTPDALSELEIANENSSLRFARLRGEGEAEESFLGGRSSVAFVLLRASDSAAQRGSVKTGLFMSKAIRTEQGGHSQVER